MDDQESDSCNNEQNIQRLIRCNEALRALVRLQQSFFTSSSTCCHCLSQLRRSRSDKKETPAECDIDKSTEKEMTDPNAEISRQLDSTVDFAIINKRLFEAISLLKEDLDAERNLRARLERNQFRADVMRFFLFAAGVFAVIALYPWC